MDTSQLNEMVLQILHEVATLCSNVHFEYVGPTDTELEHILLPSVNVSCRTSQVWTENMADEIKL